MLDWRWASVEDGDSTLSNNCWTSPVHWDPTQKLHHADGSTYGCSAKTVSAYFTSKQILPFGFEENREIPANTRHLYKICATSAQRLRRWSNIVQNVIKMFCVCLDPGLLACWRHPGCWLLNVTTVDSLSGCLWQLTMPRVSHHETVPQFRLRFGPASDAWPKTSQHLDGPADTRRWINVGLTLVHRLRRWTNVKPTLIQHLVSAVRLTWPAARSSTHHPRRRGGTYNAETNWSAPVAPGARIVVGGGRAYKSADVPIIRPRSGVAGCIKNSG